MRRSFIALVLLCGCGDDAAEGAEDGGVFLDGSSDMESDAHEGAAPLSMATVLVSSSDGLSGGLSMIDLETLEADPLVEVASGDAIGRVWFGKLYVVNRFGSDSVQVHDPDNDLDLVKEFSVGSTTDNAQDICCVSPSKCYVPRLQDSEVLIVNPLADDEMSGSVDLSDAADDGVPNADACYVANGNLLVALANLDDADPFFSPMSPGAIAVIDSETDEVTAVHETTAHNPAAGFVDEPEGATALLGSVGDWSVLDGGWDRIDLDTGEPQGIVVSEADLGGDVAHLAVCSTGDAYAIVNRCDEEFNCSTPLVPIDLDTGEVGEPVLDPGAFALTWVAADDRGRLFVADRRVDGSPTGIWVYGCDGTRLTDEPIDVGLPPAFDGVIRFL